MAKEKLTLWNDLDRSKKYIFGNWKMHKTVKETKAFFKGALKNYNANKVVAAVATPYTDIHAAVKGSKNIWAPKMWLKACLGQMKKVQNIFIGAENVNQNPSGAFTGEESIDMLKEAGVQFVIIGHSERRTMYNETDKSVNEKAQVLLKNKIVPVICCGEDIDVYNAGDTNKFIAGQIKAAFKGIDAKDAKHAIIAYEPMWAIGSGKTATPEIAENVCAFIRKTLEGMYSKAIAKQIVIQYGGSVKPANVKDILGQKDIDGALIGGASLDPKSFTELINFNK